MFSNTNREQLRHFDNPLEYQNIISYLLDLDDDLRISRELICYVVFLLLSYLFFIELTKKLYANLLGEEW